MRYGVRKETREPMEAGIADHVWMIEEMVKLLDRRSILDGLLRTA
jgi:hypothetical protein